jgi:hypothetical protein
VLIDQPLDRGGDVDDVGVAAGREGELGGVNGDGAKLTQPRSGLSFSLGGVGGRRSCDLTNLPVAAFYI